MMRQKCMPKPSFIPKTLSVQRGTQVNRVRTNETNFNISRYRPNKSKSKSGESEELANFQCLKEKLEKGYFCILWLAKLVFTLKGN